MSVSGGTGRHKTGKNNVRKKAINNEINKSNLKNIAKYVKIKQNNSKTK
jgi:hypothetical protein